MAFDGIFLHQLKNELKTQLLGAKIDKIYQPTAQELFLHFRFHKQAYKLLLSARADSPRLHLTMQTPDNPSSPPMLTMLLRKKLSGAVLMDITQNGFDRVIFLHFNATTEIGDPAQFTLCVEIMGKHSNIILLDENKKIVDAIKRVDMLTSTYRQILPGLPYKSAPEQDKFKPEAENLDKIMRAILSQDKSLSRAILDTVQGVSPLISREISSRLGFDDRNANNLSADEIILLKDDLEQFFHVVAGSGASPILYTDENGKPTEFSFMPLVQFDPAFNQSDYDSYSQLLDYYYLERDRIQRTRQNANDLFRLLENKIERVGKRISVQQNDLKECENRQELQLLAELIQANVYKLSKGNKTYEVENYYDNNNLISIPVNPARTPVQNSQYYFKKYKKTFTAERELTKQIADGIDELKYLRSMHDLLSRASSFDDILSIRDELLSEGYIRKQKKKQKKLKPLPPHTFSSSDGCTIYVGRNNTQNDELTLKRSQKDDLWFHVKDAPGSHVILSLESKSESESAVFEAATLAAYYSSARESSKADIDVTKVRHVRKPSGAKPGMVIYDNHRTISVSPDKTLVESLINNTKGSD